MRYEDLTAEQNEMTDGKTPEEILEIAKAEGYSLSDEELEAISGGASAWDEYIYRPTPQVVAGTQVIKLRRRPPRAGGLLYKGALERLLAHNNMKYLIACRPCLFNWVKRVAVYHTFPNNQSEMVAGTAESWVKSILTHVITVIIAACPQVVPRLVYASLNKW